jgi:hypothetical protein
MCIKSKFLTLFLFVFLLLISFSVWAQNSRDNAVLVTDINKKLSMGFTDKDTVYDLQNHESLDPYADRPLQKGIGIQQPVKIGYMGNEAEGRTTDFEYSTLSGAGDIYRTSTEMFADILLDLPHGQSFDYLRVWGRDSNISYDMTFFLFERCLPTSSAGNITTTTLGDVSTTGNSGDFTLLLNLTNEEIFVDNRACTYSLRTRFDTTGSTLLLYKVRADINSYQLPRSLSKNRVSTPKNLDLDKFPLNFRQINLYSPQFSEQLVSNQLSLDMTPFLRQASR